METGLASLKVAESLMSKGHNTLYGSYQVRKTMSSITIEHVWCLQYKLHDQGQAGYAEADCSRWAGGEASHQSRLVITVPPDGLLPKGARTSAGIELTKFEQSYFPVSVVSHDFGFRRSNIICYHSTVGFTIPVWSDKYAILMFVLWERIVIAIWNTKKITATRWGTHLFKSNQNFYAMPKDDNLIHYINFVSALRDVSVSVVNIS